MKKIIWASIVVVTSLCVNVSAQIIQGYVRNKWAQPIPNASLQFTSLSSGKTFTARTDANGFYQLNLPFFEKESENRSFLVFDVFPNPFSRETNFIVYALRSVRATVSIINRNGQIVRILYNAPLSEGYNYITWDGLDEKGAEMPEGMYIMQITSGKTTVAKKVLRLTNAPSSGTVAGNLDPEVLLETVVATYQVTVEAPGYKKYQNPKFIPQGKSTHHWVLFKEDTLPFRTVDHYLAIRKADNTYEPIFINGICLGISTPGTNPGNLAATKEEYRRWLTLIWEAGFNSIRTYTLHYPRFYEVLDEFNREHFERPLWLMQGVWLDEELSSPNLYESSALFDSAIAEVLDCMHGNRVIGERQGRAFGTYNLDVSDWIMGYIIGREVYPDEIIYTDSLMLHQNPNLTFYNGKFFSIDSASPSEVWWARRLDFFMDYQKSRYNKSVPLSQSSWPTLDPLTHPSEPPYPISSEDWTQVDLSKLKVVAPNGGYFASYHAYPYYPDFINDDSLYRTFSDSYGPNSYLGYLTTLKNYYGKKPLLLGEYGVPSSWGNAHYAHSGMHHGGHTEKQQGIYNIRLIKNIHQTRCAGGYLFALMDEWFKTMWYTNPIGSTYARRSLWWNVVSAEENFGFISFQTDTPNFKIWPELSVNCWIDKAKFSYDPAFFYIQLKLKRDINSNDSIWVAIDTYDRFLGESTAKNGFKLDSRSEFLLNINTTRPLLYITESYDTYGIYHGYSEPTQKYRSTITDGEPWNVVRYTNGWKEYIDIDSVGVLNFYLYSNPLDTPTSKDAVFFKNKEILVRIPWTYLNVVDPSNQEVLDDDRGTKERETRITDGFQVQIFDNWKLCSRSTEKRMLWPRWDKAWPYNERLKESYFILKNSYPNLDLKPF
ncbi:hypothetical protein JCM31826_21330 [Thermaurantimonas aggregans]|uniref:FlgD/Vpr Ig-like domain-containing protein n=1 Tax=Thermaurantimonas aggregans TaxID=2173829 RepID=A0A401XNQ9_9FLAO|nr:T9SS type A sorting domain-containing protein [Thermaurantimonas aggregans]MCX8149477.1 T9SS type A sorting domain-containing protein [Thermaurantimonas aggregans]GCD78651.1 hypothetical protein JCM31826_21330 [Thermaurantimonas aggregans]